MNLYHVSQNENNNYDTYSDFVICAESEDEARDANPSWEPDYDWYAPTIRWDVPKDSEDWYDSGKHAWCSRRDLVNVKFIGAADPSVPRGIVCKSFHAG